jgi:hypothetical protein
MYDYIWGLLRDIIEVSDRIAEQIQRQAGNTNAVEVRDANKTENKKDIQGQCEENAAVKDDGDGLILEDIRQETNKMAIEEERDALKLEAEQLRGQCKEAAALKEHRDTIILEAKRQAANM